MNREIKFRGKVVNTNQWVYGNLMVYKKHYPTITWVDDAELVGNKRTYVVYPDSVGEWAGLNDKNGQEIYEGDVVLQQGYNGKKMPMAVRFEKGAFIVGYHKGSSTRKTPMLVSSKCEVIDNVFDNPKLEQSLNK